MESVNPSMFPADWTPYLIRREPSDFVQVLRDEIRDLYASIPEVKWVVAQRSGDCYSHYEIWLYFEMSGWDDELMEELIVREFALKNLEGDPEASYDFHYISLAIPRGRRMTVDPEILHPS